MKTMQIAICGGDSKSAGRIKEIINSCGIPVNVSCYANGGVFETNPPGRFDMAIIDIGARTGGAGTFEDAVALRTRDALCGIVLVADDDKRMREAFDLGAEQYLTKPADAAKLKRALQRRLIISGALRRSCTVNVKGKLIDILFDDIRYIESRGHNCFVHTVNGIIETGSSMTMRNFESVLPPPRFVRCHNSFIVNLDHVERVENDFIMKNGETIYIRRKDSAKREQYAMQLQQ